MWFYAQFTLGVGLRCHKTLVSALLSHTITLTFKQIKSARNNLPIVTGAYFAVRLQPQRISLDNRPRKKVKAKKRSRKSFVAKQAVHFTVAVVHRETSKTAMISFIQENTAFVKKIFQGCVSEKGRKDIKATVATGAIALLVSLLTVFVINAYNNAPFFRIPMNVIILLLIPYALSVTGMTLYTKSKNGGNSTAVGLASNLTALIISNLSIVNAAILFFTK